MDGMTTAGEAIATSVSNPSSTDAIFVPFLKKRVKKLSNKVQRRKRPDMKKLVESIRQGGMEAVSEALFQSINESPDSPEKKIASIRNINECKKNKDKLKAILDAKLAAKKRNGGKTALGAQLAARRKKKKSIIESKIKSRFKRKKSDKKTILESHKNRFKSILKKHKLNESTKRRTLTEGALKHYNRAKQLNESTKRLNESNDDKFGVRYFVINKKGIKKKSGVRYFNVDSKELKEKYFKTEEALQNWVEKQENSGNFFEIQSFSDPVINENATISDKKSKFLEALKQHKNKTSKISGVSESAKKRVIEARKRILESRQRKQATDVLGESNYQAERRLIKAIRQRKINEARTRVRNKVK